MSSSQVMEESLTHRIYEDFFAIVIGTSMVSFGVILLKQAGALTGSIAGLAFLLHYLTHTAFGVFFFLYGVRAGRCVASNGKNTSS